MNLQIIHIHPDAPAKPAYGAVCNGCGVCCLAEPCPAAHTWLGARTGSCPALEWQTAGEVYRCGLLQHPQHYLRWLPAALAPVARRWLARGIAAGSGCDSDAEVDDQFGGGLPGRASQ